MKRLHCSRFTAAAAAVGLGLLFSAVAVADTVLVGDQDGFVGPDDPNGVIYRRPEFDAYVNHPSRSNCVYHNCQALPFDTDETLNWAFGHSFVDLPVLGAAQLEIHVRGGWGPGNDGIALQYINTGDPNDPLDKAWGWFGAFGFLETVEGAIGDGDGVWSDNDELTIVLDLAALPQGDGTTVNLLPLVNADGYLDVHIADDTDVDYIELSYTPAAFGLPYEPLGQALVAFGPLDPNDPNSLTVMRISNFDASGNDGVTMGLGAAQGNTVSFYDLDPALMQTGAEVTFAARGSANGVPGQSLGQVQIVDVGSDFQATADYSAVGATDYRVVALREGQIVFAGSGANDEPAALIPIRIKLLYKKYNDEGTLIESCLIAVETSLFTMLVPSDDPNDPNAATTVEADTLMFTPVNPLIPADFISNVEVTANDAANVITLSAASLFFADTECLALGASIIQGSNDAATLTVGNIGDSGQDGVQMSLDGAEAVEVTWADLAPPEPNAWLEAAYWGSSNGTPQNLGSSRVSDMGGTLDVSVADFGSTQSIIVYNGGQLVSRANGHVGTVALVSDWPTGAIVPTSTSNPFCPPDCQAAVVGWTWSAPVTIEVPGSAPLMGDALYIASDDTVAPDQLDTTTLRAAGIPSITIQDVVSSVPCPGDLDGNGAVDLADLAILLSNYNTSSGMTYAEGDLDGDGDVDLADLATLLAVYGASC